MRGHRNLDSALLHPGYSLSTNGKIPNLMAVTPERGNDKKRIARVNGANDALPFLQHILLAHLIEL